VHYVADSTGVGKSFVACALAQKACRDGYAALYTRAQSLFRDLAMARADGSLRNLLARLSHIDVLVIDDWAMAPLSEPERRDFWEICEDRYQVRSTILTSQLPVSKWHEQIGDPTLADGILDRLVHNAHRIAATSGFPEYHSFVFALKKGELARQTGNDRTGSQSDQFIQGVFQLHLTTIDVVAKYPAIVRCPHALEFWHYKSGVLLRWRDLLDVFGLQKVWFRMMKFAVENCSLFGIGQCSQESLPSVRVDEGFNKSLFVRIHHTLYFYIAAQFPLIVSLDQ